MHRDPPSRLRLGELADAATLALLLALADLPPHERLAFLLERLFGLPPAEVATLVAPPPRDGLTRGLRNLEVAC